MADHDEGPASLSRLDRIDELVRGLTLLEADQALDQARLFVWLAAFSGKPVHAIPSIPREMALPVSIAGTLIGLTPWEASLVVETARIRMWANGYPNSAPARQFNSPANGFYGGSNSIVRH